MFGIASACEVFDIHYGTPTSQTLLTRIRDSERALSECPQLLMSCRKTMRTGPRLLRPYPFVEILIVRCHRDCFSRRDFGLNPLSIVADLDSQQSKPYTYLGSSGPHFAPGYGLQRGERRPDARRASSSSIRTFPRRQEIRYGSHVVVPRPKDWPPGTRAHRDPAGHRDPQGHSPS